MMCANVGANVVGVWYGMVWQSLLLQCVPCVRACLWQYPSVGQCLRVGVNFCGITGGTGGAIVAAFSVLLLGEHAQSVRTSVVVRLTKSNPEWHLVGNLPLVTY